MFPSSLNFLTLGSNDSRASQLVSFSLTFLLALFLASIFTLIVKYKSKTHMKNKPMLPLPPGPTPWPLVGNLPEMWRNKPTFRWILGLMKELNTEIACIRLANVHVIPVSSPEIAREFLKTHDSVFATRPLTPATECTSYGYLTIAVVPWGEQWKKMRKVVASEIVNPVKLRQLLNKRNEEADNLVRFIYNQCKRPDNDNCIGSIVDVRLATRQYCGNVIRKMMFNKRYFGKGREDGGPGFEEVEHVESLIIALVYIYAFSISDYIPCLTGLDLDGHQKIIRDSMRILNKYHDPIIDERVQQWRDGKKKEPEDMLDAFITAKDSNGEPLLSPKEIKAQCTELMFAAVDNPSNAIEWAMAEMINQPEILQKAVEEIERVVGKERLVQESDIPQLPYIKACAREAFRLHPVAPFNVPHVSHSNMNVAGYFIPKGSHVVLSRIALGRNPRVWEEPLKFKPERHLNDGSAKVEISEPDLRFISFSTGRRGCMGASLGTVMTVMLLARLLQGFTWSVPPNEKKIDLSESLFNLFPAKPVHAHAKPRLLAKMYLAI